MHVFALATLLALSDPGPAAAPPVTPAAPAETAKPAEPAVPPGTTDGTPAAPTDAVAPAPATPAETAQPGAADASTTPATQPAVGDGVKVEIKATLKASSDKPVDLKPRILYVVQHALIGGAVLLAVTQCIVLLGAAATLLVLPAGNPLDRELPSDWRGGVAVLFLAGVVPGSLMLAGMGILAAVISAVRGWPDAFGG